MPGLTGDEASQRLREFGYQNDIVFLTVSREHFRSAFDVRALHYVVKGDTYGVYPEEIKGLQRDYAELWSRVSDVPNQLAEVVEL